MRTSVWLIALLVGGGGLAAQARTLVVPTQYKTIQAAIDAARGGDTVLVKPGTYAEQIDFKGKAITVRSSQGPNVTTIYGPQTPAVKFFSGEPPAAVLMGFSIRSKWRGGPLIQANKASPTIAYNELVGPHGGTGIECVYSPDVVIEGNLVAWTSGMAGIWVWWAKRAIIRKNVLIGNNTWDFGGGICVDQASSSPLIERNVLIGNRAGKGGGGIAAHGTYVGGAIRENVVLGNRGGPGGGIYLECSSAEVSRNLVAGNIGGGIAVASEFGGCWPGVSPVVRENLVVGNYEPIFGGGGILVAGKNVQATLLNNTVLWNRGKQTGGGLKVGETAKVTVANGIFYGNQAPRGPEIFVGTAVVSIDHSLVFGGRARVSTWRYSTLVWGPGMISGSPGFVDEAAGDFHLRWDSICRDAGVKISGLSAKDWEDDPRSWGKSPDIGADEFYPRLCHGPAAARGSGLLVRFLGPPGAVAWLGMAPALRTSPLPLPGLTGGLWLTPSPLSVVPVGRFGATGVRSLTLEIPKSWPLGALYTQALAGTVLTNWNRLEVR